MWRCSEYEEMWSTLLGNTQWNQVHAFKLPVAMYLTTNRSKFHDQNPWNSKWLWTLQIPFGSTTLAISKRATLFAPSSYSCRMMCSTCPALIMPTLIYSRCPTPLAPFGVPIWNPFLNFLGMSFIVRIRPVPVVFLRLAFSPQLSVHTALWSASISKMHWQLIKREGKDSAKARRRSNAWLASNWRTATHTLPNLSSRIPARRTCVFLDVEGSST